MVDFDIYIFLHFQFFDNRTYNPYGNEVKTSAVILFSIEYFTKRGIKPISIQRKAMRDIILANILLLMSVFLLLCVLFMAIPL